MKEELIEFIRWYWSEVNGKPYDIRSEELIEIYLKEKNKNYD